MTRPLDMGPQGMMAASFDLKPSSRRQIPFGLPRSRNDSLPVTIRVERRSTGMPEGAEDFVLRRAAKIGPDYKINSHFESEKGPALQEVWTRRKNMHDWRRWMRC